ncbi:carboxypeptidase-like regulatory domain-containing protein, partial [Acinetobacter baumannii]
TLVLLLNCIFSAAQNITVQGTVVDEATALPLPGAVVFINQTTKGQKTDSSGFFSITDVNEKQFELVAYAEHYEPLV